MTRLRLRAVVLAAGLGTRLRPLTASLPKPLLPVLGRPLLAGTLGQLAAAGVEAAAINLHHRAGAIPAALGDSFAGMPLHYSREDPILGTLGALHPLRDFLAPAELVLLLNGDSLCRWPLAELVEHHRRTRPLATLLLSSTADVRWFGGGAIDAAGRMVAFPVGARDAARWLDARAEGAAETDAVTAAEPASGGATAASGRGQSAGATSSGVSRAPIAALRVFAGAHVFAPELAFEAPPFASDIVRDLYAPRLAAGARLETVSTAAPWHDLGTPGRYLEAVLDWARRSLASGVGEPALAPGRARAGDPGRPATSEPPGTGSWIHPSALVDPSARLERAVIEADATVEEAVVGRALLLLDGARAGRASRLERVVVAPGVAIAPGASIRNALVTPLEWGTVRGSRRDGPLVLTPLELPPGAAFDPAPPSTPDRERS